MTRLFLLLAVQAFCGFCLCLGTSLFLDSPLRAGVSGSLLLVGVNLAPSMSYGISRSLAAGESFWPVIGLMLGIGAMVGSGVLLMMQRDVNAAWALLSRIVFIVCLAGVVAFLFTDPDRGGWPAWPMPIPQNTSPAVSIVYLSAIGFACYGLVRDRFDDAVGRSP